MEKQNVAGIVFVLGAYILWGVLPIYWRWLEEVPPLEILAHRIVWSFLFVLVIVLLLKRKQLKFFFQVEMSRKKTWLGIFLSSVIISMNWFTYIYTVNTGHILEASLGYYINPLVSVVLGVVVLHERLDRAQTIATLIASAGVLYMTFSIGKFPWLGLTLALTFGFYGLAKKLINVDSMLGLFFETMFMFPFALVFLVYLGVGGSHGFLAGSVAIDLLLIGTGVATALPLMWFGIGAQKIPLYMVGFIQYVSPTINLFIGVLLFNESFTFDHFITFACIWTAIIIFTVANIREGQRRRKVPATTVQAKNL